MDLKNTTKRVSQELLNEMNKKSFLNLVRYQSDEGFANVDSPENFSPNYIEQRYKTRGNNILYLRDTQEEIDSVQGLINKAANNPFNEKGENLSEIYDCKIHFFLIGDINNISPTLLQKASHFIYEKHSYNLFYTNKEFHDFEKAEEREIKKIIEQINKLNNDIIFQEAVRGYVENSSIITYSEFDTKEYKFRDKLEVRKKVRYDRL